MRTSQLAFDAARSEHAQPSSTTMFDESRFHDNGAMTAVVPFRLPSGLWVYQFNGATSWVNIAQTANLKRINSLQASLEIWFNITTPTNYNRFYDSYTGPTDRLYFGIYGNKLWYTLGNTTKFANAPLVNNRWYHTVLTWYNSINTQVYLNGVPDGALTAGTVWTPGVGMAIGAVRTGTTNVWDGYLALPRIYRTTLTAGQVWKRFQENRRWFEV